MHFFPPINLAPKMLNCFCSNLKRRVWGYWKKFTSGISLRGLLTIFKVKTCCKENEKLGVLGMSAPSKVLFFDFLHKDALWCILIM